MELENFKKLNKFKKIILIDQISSIDKTNTDTAYVLLNNTVLNKNKYLGKLNTNGNIFLFSWQYFKRGYLTTLADYKSFKNIENVYKSFKKKNYRIVKFFNFLYQSKKFEIALKKNILVKLKNYYEIKIVKRIISTITKKEIIEQLDNNNYLNPNKLNKFDSKNLLYKLKKLITFILYPFYFCLNKKISFKTKKKTYNNFYRIYENGVGVGNLGNLDWLITEKKNDIFVLEDLDHKISRHTQALKDNNYYFIDCNTKIQTGEISLYDCIKNIFFLAPIGFFISIYLTLFRSSYFLFFYKSWISFFKWDNFVKNYSGKNYIVYHNYQEDHILRNIFLKKNNFNLIHYKHTSSENIFNYNLKNKYNNSHQAFIYYDKEFHQTIQSIEMSSQNMSLTPIKLVCGPTLLDRNKGKNINENLNFSVTKKQIIFFNSSFTDGHAANPVLAHLNFLKFIHEVLEKNDYRIIFKSKKKVELYLQYNEEFRLIINNLKRNKNIEIIDHSLDLNEMINSSEISIHMPFASSSIVSLSNKKKFFFYDNLNYFKNSYFSKFKNIKLLSKTAEMNYELIDFYSKMDQNTYEEYISEFYKETFGSSSHDLTDVIKKNL